MADDNDDSWLYGGPDEGIQHEDSHADDADVSPVKNGSLDHNKTYDTFDEHNFEVGY